MSGEKDGREANTLMQQNIWVRAFYRTRMLQNRAGERCRQNIERGRWTEREKKINARKERGK